MWLVAMGLESTTLEDQRELCFRPYTHNPIIVPKV